MEDIDSLYTSIRNFKNSRRIGLTQSLKQFKNDYLNADKGKL